MKRIFGLILAVLVFTALFYLSRYWSFSLWGREGLLGFNWLRPQGNLVPVWLRGSGYGAFAILAWAVGAFLILTLLQSIWGRVFKE